MTQNISNRTTYILAIVFFFSIVFFLLGMGVGYLVGQDLVPAAESTEVGFARDMSEHHQQAVDMSALVYDRTEDEVIRTLAYDILTTQQAQIGIMRGWLDSWGHPWLKSGPRMVWMGMSVDGRMPGMASVEEINKLGESFGVEAEILFLQLMIPHHQSGVVMAQAAADQTEIDYVHHLAQGMVDAQESEIQFMRRLLEERGVEFIPDTTDMMEMDQ